MSTLHLVISRAGEEVARATCAAAGGMEYADVQWQGDRIAVQEALGLPLPIRSTHAVLRGLLSQAAESLGATLQVEQDGEYAAENDIVL